MAGLIDDLLQLSRQTRTEMNPQILDLGEMARKITAELFAQEPHRELDKKVKNAL